MSTVESNWECGDRVEDGVNSGCCWNEPWLREKPKCKHIFRQGASKGQGDADWHKVNTQIK